MYLWYLYIYNYDIYIYTIYDTHIYDVSLIDQLVKNLPAMQEILVPFLGGEDPLEKG